MNVRIAKKRHLGITPKTALFCSGSERTLHGEAAAEEIGVRPNLVLVELRGVEPLLKTVKPIDAKGFF